MRWGGRVRCAGCGRCTASSPCSAKRSCRSRSTASPRGATTVGHRFHHPGDDHRSAAPPTMSRSCAPAMSSSIRTSASGSIRDGAARLAAKRGLTLRRRRRAGGRECRPDRMAGAAARRVRRRLPRRAARGDRAHHAHQPEIFRLHRRRGGAGAGVRLRRQHRREATAARRSSRATAGCSRRGSPTRASSGSRTSRCRSRSRRRSSTGIVFHEKLGTVADKVERVAKLARWLVESGVVEGADADQVERAARLAKADLVTGMVGEFPELQGVIGGYLAEAQGEPKAVADAIRDHYKPAGQGDEVPTAPVTVAVALADKLDTLAALLRDRREADRIEGSVRASAGGDRRRSSSSSQRTAAPLTEAVAARSRTARAVERSAAAHQLDCRRTARFLRRPPEGSAARGGRSARPDRCGVRARWRGRSRAPARPREGAADLRRDRRRRRPARPPTSARRTS